MNNHMRDFAERTGKRYDWHNGGFGAMVLMMALIGALALMEKIV